MVDEVSKSKILLNFEHYKINLPVLLKDNPEDITLSALDESYLRIKGILNAAKEAGLDPKDKEEIEKHFNFISDFRLALMVQKGGPYSWILRFANKLGFWLRNV